jgi:hypothetical protein
VVAEDDGDAFVACLQGEKVTGGGVVILDGRLHASAPAASATAFAADNTAALGWRGIVMFGDVSDITVYVICAS